MSVRRWTVARPAPGRIADVVLVALHTGPLLDVPLSASAFGLPPDGLDLVAVTAQSGPEGLAWLDGFRRGALRTVAGMDLGDLGPLDAADASVTVRATIAAPSDRRYLQAAWAVARWLAARGASVIVDARAMRYWSAAASLAVPPDAPFDIQRELSVVVETEPTPGLGGHVVHTRGMVKLAAPELVTVVAPEDRQEAVAALWRIAARLVDGDLTAGDPVLGGAAVPLFLTPAPPGSFVGALHLDNDALLVVAEDGGAPVWPRADG